MDSCTQFFITITSTIIGAVFAIITSSISYWFLGMNERKKHEMEVYAKYQEHLRNQFTKFEDSYAEVLVCLEGMKNSTDIRDVRNAMPIFIRNSRNMSTIAALYFPEANSETADFIGAVDHYMFDIDYHLREHPQISGHETRAMFTIPIGQQESDDFEVEKASQKLDSLMSQIAESFPKAK